MNNSILCHIGNRIKLDEVSDEKGQKLQVCLVRFILEMIVKP